MAVCAAFLEGKVVPAKVIFIKIVRFVLESGFGGQDNNAWRQVVGSFRSCMGGSRINTE
jgi:hypothetical protein